MYRIIKREKDAGVQKFLTKRAAAAEGRRGVEKTLRFSHQKGLQVRG